ncbi:MAG: precorrin-2 C(20)-methyltransferase [Planctomycetes bacterium]|nr:precorrin-2 C(20)-methyltransferase [Planctomycetota bacterium]
MSPGKVYLVGVGPGDPELVTRRAARVLREADTVYHPGRDEQTGFAIRIVQGLLPPHATVRAAAVEMAESGNRYKTLAAELAAEARAGRRVAFITEGDPLLYSTASRVLEILKANWPDVPVEIVPGVTSLTAVAAAAGQSLVQSAETLVVVPACHHPDDLERLIESHDRVALLKVGSVFPQIVALLRRRGWLDRAIYAEKVGTPEQRVVRDLASVDPEKVSYFSMVLVTARPH